MTTLLLLEKVLDAVVELHSITEASVTKAEAEVNAVRSSDTEDDSAQSAETDTVAANVLVTEATMRKILAMPLSRQTAQHQVVRRVADAIADLLTVSVVAICMAEEAETNSALWTLGVNDLAIQANMVGKSMSARNSADIAAHKIERAKACLAIGNALASIKD